MNKGWISVKERLPEEYEKVLVIDDKLEYKIDYVVKFGTEFIWGCRLADEYKEVTHWMPLPLPPKE